MNPRLVACLIASILIGASAAGLVVALDWGWMAAFLAYSLCGSVALVGATLVVLPGEERRPRAVPVLALPVPPRAPA